MWRKCLLWSNQESLLNLPCRNTLQSEESALWVHLSRTNRIRYRLVRMHLSCQSSLSSWRHVQSLCCPSRMDRERLYHLWCWRILWWGSTILPKMPRRLHFRWVNSKMFAELSRRHNIQQRKWKVWMPKWATLDRKSLRDLPCWIILVRGIQILWNMRWERRIRYWT